MTFNNGAIYHTAVSDQALFNSAPVEVLSSLTNPIDSIGLNYTGTVYDGDERTNLDVTTAYNSGPGTIGLQIAAGSGISAATFKKGKTFLFSNGVIATLEADVSLNNSSETVATVSLKPGTGTAIPDTETTFFEENLIVTQAYNGTDNNIGLRVDDELISSITFVATTDLEFSNGAVAALDNSDTFTNSSEVVADVTLDTTTMTTKATTYYEENLVADLIFTNNDDDILGITATQTDPDRAIAEGNSNNFFSVVLDSQPTAPVEITLAPSDDNIQLVDEFAGESHRITFDLTNWNIPQAIEVTAVDDSLLEYDHFSTISFSVSSADLGYNAVAVPNDVEVFIQDDELPAANVQVVAGAIEANSPGYFVITLDEPAPSGYNDTGIVVTYSVTGTADSDGVLPVTDDVQTITGSARIAPGLTSSQLIAFPIDDFKTEGIDLKVTAAYSDSDPNITLQINVLPFEIGADDDASNGTIDLLLDSPEPGETTILSKGTILLFNGSTTATVNQTAIIKENAATSVSITLSGLNGDIVTGGTAYQEVTLPSGTNLKFGNGTVVTTSASANVSNETDTVVTAALTQGTALSITAGTPEANTTLQGESVVVTLLSGVGGVSNNWDFETQTLEGFTQIDPASISGDGIAFSGNPVSTTQVTDESGVSGSYFIRSDWHTTNGKHGDSHTGVLESQEFVVGANATLDFLLAGGAHAFGVADPDNLAGLPQATAFNLEQLVGPNDWEVAFTATSTNTTALAPMQWDLSGLAGETVRLRIYDTHTGGSRTVSP